VSAHDLVLAGVRLLDEKGPPNWRQTLKSRATIHNLNMAYGRPIDEDTSCCVLALIFGSFNDGCVALGILARNAHIYGFEVDVNKLDPGVSILQNYRQLTDAWKAWFTV